MTNYHLRPLTFFASIGRPLERYFTEVVKAQGETLEAELWIEAEDRLAQLDHLVARIKELQQNTLDLGRESAAAFREAGDQHRRDDVSLYHSPALTVANDLGRARDEALFQVKLASESFYYFAARLLGILQSFPHLKNLDAPGIRSVRNHLIEHPEKGSSGVTQQNWSLEESRGPAFKNARRQGQDHVPTDEGLFNNAAELRDRIESKLKQVLAHLPPDTSPVAGSIS